MRCPAASTDDLRHAETTFYPCPGSGSHNSAFVARQCEARCDVTILKDGADSRQPGLDSGHVDRTRFHFIFFPITTSSYSWADIVKCWV
jgi:hypothetical protein